MGENITGWFWNESASIDFVGFAFDLRYSG
jgi:hypothetical protein